MEYSVLIPDQNILGCNPTGEYTVTMISKDKKGKIEK
jgi:hypothetical protein